MPRRITPTGALDNARTEAKRWLKALRANDADARARLVRILPEAPASPGLRDVQHALARERGFDGWTALRDALAATEARAPRELVARFLDNACPDHHVRGGPDHVRARHTALRLLARHPDIARASFATSVVCGDLEEVRRQLAGRPALARDTLGMPGAGRAQVGEAGDLHNDRGPKGWTALLHLCFTRLPLPAVDANAVAIARLLLDHGADPNAYFMAGSSRYTPLVGVIGEGEEDRPPHQHRDALARLLMERGAEPYDIQVVYNLGFRGRAQWYLELACERAQQLGRGADWDDPEWSMLDMGGYGSGARWHLERAIRHDDLALAEWCLAHGANADSPPASDPRLPKRSLYEEAVRQGRTAIAELLARHGAPRTEPALDEMERFVDACLRQDREAVRATLARRPEWLHAPEPLHAAARRDRADVVAFLLDHGVSPDASNGANERALHVAAYHDARRVAELLIARGADVDAVESTWHNTPLGGAVYHQHHAMMDLLAARSRDVWALTYAGYADRLRDVLGEDPARARIVADGQTPLMWLPPDDEARALEIARLLLASGADPTLRNADGMTAAERAERNGMYEVAAMLRNASPRSPGSD